MNKNKPLFDINKQNEVILKYQPLAKSLMVAENVKQWNALRQNLNDTFPGTLTEKIMIFGYIDNVIFPRLLKMPLFIKQPKIQSKEQHKEQLVEEEIKN